MGVISITTTQLAIVLNSIAVLFLIIGLFFLYKCKQKVLGMLKQVFTLFIWATISGILFKMIIIFTDLKLIPELFSYNSLAIVPIALFLVGIRYFYKSITSAQTSPPRHHRNHHRKHHRRR